MQSVRDYVSFNKYYNTAHDQMLPVLDDKYYEQMEFVEMYVDTILHPIYISALVEQLDIAIPLGEQFAHIPRVKGGTEIIIAPVNSKKAKSCLDYMHNLCFYTDTLMLEPYVALIPKKQPFTQKQYEDATQYWPCFFNENKTVEKLLTNKYFNPVEISHIEMYMDLAISSAKQAKSPVCAMAVDPKTNKVVGVATDQRKKDPSKHAILLLIQRIAEDQGIEWEPPNHSTIKSMKDVYARLSASRLKLLNTCQPSTSNSVNSSPQVNDLKNNNLHLVNVNVKPNNSSNTTADETNSTISSNNKEASKSNESTTTTSKNVLVPVHSSSKNVAIQNPSTNKRSFSVVTDMSNKKTFELKENRPINYNAEIIVIDDKDEAICAVKQQRGSGDKHHIGDSEALSNSSCSSIDYEDLDNDDDEDDFEEDCSSDEEDLGGIPLKVTIGDVDESIRAMEEKRKRKRQKQKDERKDEKKQKIDFASTSNSITPRFNEGKPHLLSSYEIYVTKEPCFMCATALIESQVKTVFYGCFSPQGALGSMAKLHILPDAPHNFSVFSCVLESRCQSLLQYESAGETNRFERVFDPVSRLSLLRNHEPILPSIPLTAQSPIRATKIQSTKFPTFFSSIPRTGQSPISGTKIQSTKLPTNKPNGQSTNQSVVAHSATHGESKIYPGHQQQYKTRYQNKHQRTLSCPVISLLGNVGGHQRNYKQQAKIRSEVPDIDNVNIEIPDMDQIQSDVTNQLIQKISDQNNQPVKSILAQLILPSTSATKDQWTKCSMQLPRSRKKGMKEKTKTHQFEIMKQLGEPSKNSKQQPQIKSEVPDIDEANSKIPGVYQVPNEVPDLSRVRVEVPDTYEEEPSDFSDEHVEVPDTYVVQNNNQINQSLKSILSHQSIEPAFPATDGQPMRTLANVSVEPPNENDAVVMQPPMYQEAAQSPVHQTMYVPTNYPNSGQIQPTGSHSSDLLRMQQPNQYQDYPVDMKPSTSKSNERALQMQQQLRQFPYPYYPARLQASVYQSNNLLGMQQPIHNQYQDYPSEMEQPNQFYHHYPPQVQRSISQSANLLHMQQPNHFHPYYSSQMQPSTSQSNDLLHMEQPDQFYQYYPTQMPPSTFQSDDPLHVQRSNELYDLYARRMLPTIPQYLTMNNQQRMQQLAAGPPQNTRRRLYPLLLPVKIEPPAVESRSPEELSPIQSPVNEE